MTEWLLNLVSNLPKELGVLILSIMPIGELRFAIPYGFLQNLEPWKTFIIAVLGNMIPVPFIIFFIRPIFSLMKRWKFFVPIVEHFERKAEKNSGKVAKYEFWGILFLVAIPLPGTGAWTGALVAALLDLRIKKAIPAIYFGVIIAGVIMLILSMFGKGLLTSI